MSHTLIQLLIKLAARGGCPCSAFCSFPPGPYGGHSYYHKPGYWYHKPGYW
jgi:hypothetical protein